MGSSRNTETANSEYAREINTRQEPEEKLCRRKELRDCKPSIYEIKVVLDYLQKNKKFKNRRWDEPFMIFHV